MKKKLALIVICLLCLVTLLTGCNSIKLDSVPLLTDTVYGNGSYVVRKGEYVYFTKSYVDGTTLTKNDNKEGKVTETAIYRTKLEDGKVKTDEEGFVVNYELVVSKVAGHKDCALYIFDDYLYYSTPNMDYNPETGELQATLGFLDICRVKLDGSENEKLYSTEKFDVEKSFYKVYKMGTKVYVVLFDGTDIVKIEVDGKNVDSSVLVEGVSEVKMKEVENYVYAENNTVSQFDKCVYYTRALTEEDGYLNSEDKGNIIGRVDVVTGTKLELKNPDFATYSLLDVKDGYVFYTKDNLVYANDFARAIDSEIQITKTDKYTVTAVLDTVKNGDKYDIQGVVVNFESKSFIVKGYEDNKLVSKKLLDVEVTPSFIEGNYIYYLDGTVLNRVDYTQDEAESEIVSQDTAYDSTQLVGEYDNGYIYIFKNYDGDTESGKYLARINLANKIQPEENAEEDAEGEVNTNLGYEIEDVCKIDKAHIKTVEEDETSESN